MLSSAARRRAFFSEANKSMFREDVIGKPTIKTVTTSDKGSSLSDCLLTDFDFKNPIKLPKGTDPLVLALEEETRYVLYRNQTILNTSLIFPHHTMEASLYYASQLCPSITQEVKVETSLISKRKKGFDEEIDSFYRTIIEVTHTVGSQTLEVYLKKQLENNPTLPLKNFLETYLTIPKKIIERSPLQEISLDDITNQRNILLKL